MKNALGRYVPEGFKPFVGSKDYLNHSRTTEKVIYSENKGNKLLRSISEAFDALGITDSMTLSFHHHLRNGDLVMNLVCEEIRKRGLKDITIAASSIFPNHRVLIDCIENGNVTNIYTSYFNGGAAKAVSEGKLKGLLYMDTHGGRSRAIESGDIKIDVAFIAVPASDAQGNGNGYSGPSACGSLGYAIPDMLYAKKKVVVTDNLLDEVAKPVIQAPYIDYVVVVDKIGDASGIESGTTRITRDPVGLKIAEKTAALLDELGLLEDGFAMQTGAGGTTLAVTKFIRDIMLKKNIKARFASGGITRYHAEMLAEGLIEKIYDVQCFDLGGVKSIASNPNHIEISAFQYGNPYEDAIVNHLDFVILGATEIDLNFNVNVTTATTGLIMGGSGGHSDTANGAKVTVVVSPLMKSRLPIIRPEITTVTTPGEDVDVFVTERGIAINPRRTDLLEKLQGSRLKIVPIEELYKLSLGYTGVPESKPRNGRIIGVVRYRDQTVIDTLYQM